MNITLTFEATGEARCPCRDEWFVVPGGEVKLADHDYTYGVFEILRVVDKPAATTDDKVAKMRQALQAALPFIPDGMGRLAVCGKCVSCGGTTPYSDYTHCAKCAMVIAKEALQE